MAALTPNRIPWARLSGTQGLHPHTLTLSVHLYGPTFRQGLPLPLRPEGRTGASATLGCHVCLLPRPL